ncbi:protein FAM161A isoform X1 [Takifugu rubripes]|uniref:protein FAM161A isoform X1 n=1 Tax=Takifugu rubripes TaxID=31033 RepID=UPI0011458514|nr:protein FAM161A isoform X1 [Takifugu rubripes]
MANAHRTNALVTSCLKTPVDPQTKAPLASYERDALLRIDNRDFEELQYEDSGSEFCDEDALRKGSLSTVAVLKAHRPDLSEIFFSNEEYYRKLEELKKAHLQTMADLESMYQEKLLLNSTEAAEVLETGPRLLSSDSKPVASHGLRKSLSAVDLRRSSAQSDSSGRREPACNDVEKGLLFSPKEHIKNMWRDFQIPAHTRQLSSSLRSLPVVPKRQQTKQEHDCGEAEPFKHKTTVPKPFQMTLRESERRRRGIKTRAEVEIENRELRRQLEELTECQKKFRASPVPAHVYLPQYAELQEQQRRMRLQETHNLRTVPKPFSFLERERLKKEQKEQVCPPTDHEKFRPFKAKPVPKSVYAAGSEEHIKEELLYRSIKIHMRAEELLHSAATPPSMIAQRLSERKRTKEASTTARDEGFPHRPRINREVPDFEARYRCFQEHLKKHKELKHTTICEPFELRTSQISSRRERVLTDMGREQSSPREQRWPFISPGLPRTPTSSLCSSLSGSLELLPTKVTSATKKRHEAVRKVLEQRRKVEEEEERWREKQRQRERKLQRVVSQRAHANDPHLALSQTHQRKLKEFRRQELQRRREYQQEIKEMQKRVMGRPLLLEQVAQKSAKQAADRRYTDTLQGCDLTEEFVLSKAATSGAAHRELLPDDGKQSDQDEPELGYEPVQYRRVFLNDEDVEVNPSEDVGGGAESSQKQHDEGEDDAGDNAHCSDDNYSYSDVNESYSSDTDHDMETTYQEDA